MRSEASLTQALATLQKEYDQLQQKNQNDLVRIRQR